MAEFSMTTLEMAVLSSPKLPEVIKSLRGDLNGFSFDIIANLPILGKQRVPMALEFVEFLSGEIIFKLRAGSENPIIKRAFPILIGILLNFKPFQKTPDFVRIIEDMVHINAEALGAKYNLPLNITDFVLSNGKCHIELTL
ncbi:MAG: hypothetical protein K9I69_05010 [Ignavibacteriales bacterium]|nr:hypothetical protein [Ignavibacteriales bacterium]